MTIVAVGDVDVDYRALAIARESYRANSKAPRPYVKRTVLFVVGLI